MLKMKSPLKKYKKMNHLTVKKERNCLNYIIGHVFFDGIIIGHVKHR
jgi:hypothetical protein